MLSCTSPISWKRPEIRLNLTVMVRHAAAAVAEEIGSRQPWKERRREKSRAVQSEEIEVDAGDATAGIVEAIAIVSLRPRMVLLPKLWKLLRMEISRARLRAWEKELPELMAVAGGVDGVDGVVGVAVNRPVMQT
jgi:hypothetical protein